MTRSALDDYKALKSLKTLDGDHNQGIMIKSTLDDIKKQNLYTIDALCPAPGKAEPLSQCEPKGSQFLKSLKTLDGDHNEDKMTQSARDDNKYQSLYTGNALYPDLGKTEPLSQCEPKRSQFLESLNTPRGPTTKGKWPKGPKMITNIRGYIPEMPYARLPARRSHCPSVSPRGPSSWSR